MRLSNLGALLEDLQAVLHAKGCQVTELSVTVYPASDDEPEEVSQTPVS